MAFLYKSSDMLIPWNTLEDVDICVCGEKAKVCQSHMFKLAGDARQAKLLTKMKSAIAPGIALNAGEDNYIARNRHSLVSNFSMNRGVS
jgi:hypothetical protein